MRVLPKKLAALLSVCAVLAAGTGFGGSDLFVKAEQGPGAYDFTGTDALTQSGVTSQGATYIPGDGTTVKTVFAQNMDQTPPTNMAQLEESNSRLGAAMGWATDDAGAFDGYFLGTKADTPVWAETFWADEGKTLNAVELQVLTDKAVVPVLKVELSATEDFTEKTEFTAARELVVRPDSYPSHLYRFTVPDGVTFPWDARYVRFSFSREDGENIPANHMYLVSEIRLGMQASRGGVAADAGMAVEMSTTVIEVSSGDFNIRPVYGNAEIQRFLTSNVSPVVHAIRAPLDAAQFTTVFQHDQEIDQFALDLVAYANQAGNFRVYAGHSLEEVNDPSAAAEIEVKEEAIVSEADGYTYDGIRYSAADANQLLGKGYTFIRFEMDVQMNSYWSPYISEIHLKSMNAADRLAALYEFPEAAGSVMENGGGLLVDGTHNLAPVEDVTENTYLPQAHLAGRAGDSSFYGVFRVPDSNQGALKNVRLLVAYSSEGDKALRFTTAATLEEAGDVSTWTEVPLASKAGFINNGSDGRYTAYYADVTDDTLADATYIYFEHAQSSDPSKLWYDQRGAIRAVQFTDSVVTKTAEIILGAPGLRDFGVQVSLGSLTPETVGERLQLLVSDDGIDYMPVSVRLEETAAPGVYTVYAKELLPEGLTKLKIVMQGPLDTAQEIRLYRAELYYEGGSYAITAAAGENGALTVPEAAGFAETVTVGVTPDENYMLDTLTVTTASGRGIPVDGLSFVMPHEPVTVAATFRSDTYAIEVEAGCEHGSITAPATGRYGTDVQVQVTADEGYMLDAIEVIGADGTSFTVESDTFPMPGQNVTLRATFRYREVEALEALGASIRLDPSLTEGKRGIRFKAVYTDDANDGRLTVDGREYTVESFGFYRVRETDLKAIGGELGNALFEAHSDVVADIPFEKAIADEVVDGSRRIEYAAVLRDIADDEQYVRFAARPYIKAVRDGRTVYFYGESVCMSIYEIKTYGKQQETASLEAALLRGEEYTDLSFHTIVQGSVQVEGQAPYTDFTPGGIVYEEGVDYEIDYASGRIRRLPGSRIADYNSHIASSGQAQTAENFTAFDASGTTVYVSYEYVTEAVPAYGFEANTTLKDAAAAVTADSPVLSADTSFAQKLKEGGKLTYLVIGDSISTGAQYTPASLQYFNRVAADLTARQENLQVKVKNFAVGGTWADNGVEQLTRAKETGYQPDLITMAFGMNDQAGYAGEASIGKYISDYRNMIAYAQEQWPQAQIVLVTPMPPADIFVWNGGHTGEYAEALKALAGELSLPVADVYGMFDRMKTEFGKDDGELIITNANHPGPYGHELYARTICSLFDGLDG